MFSSQNDINRSEYIAPQPISSFSVNNKDDSISGNISEFSKNEPFEGKQSGFLMTVTNLVNSLIGSEILSISRSMKYCGLVVSVVLMTLTAALSYIATVMVVRLQYLTHAENFNDLAVRLLGKWNASILNILVLLFTYSCLVAYLIVAGDNIKSWFTLMGIENWMNGWRRMIVMLMYSLILPVPLTIPKNIGFFSIFSTFGNLACCLYLVVMIYEGFKILPEDGIHETVITGKLDIKLFNSISVYSLMFALPAICLPLLKNTNPRIQHRYRIVGCSFFTCYLFVIIPGVLGYLMFGSTTSDIVLNNFSNSDVIIQIVRSGFFLVVNASYPVVGLTVASSLSAIFFKVYEPSSLHWKRRVFILFCTNFPPILIAMVCPNIYPVVSIGGALGGCLTNFFYPALFWIKNSTKKLYHFSNILCIIFAVFGFVCAAIATYQAVELAINPND